jgi:hypothetical protein
LWKENIKDEMKCFQITRASSVYTKQRSMLKNKLHRGAVLGEASKAVLRYLRCNLIQPKKEIKS